MNVSADTTAECLMLALIQAGQSLEARLEEAFARVGLSAARFGVLEQLARAGEPITLGVLADQLCCVRSNITQLVDRLEAEGLVHRVADPSDRRSVRAELTGAGRERWRAGAEEFRKLRAEFEDSLPHPTRTSLRRALEALR